MNVKHEKVAENSVKLTVVVPAEKFNECLDRAFEKVVKEVEIKGFRKGAVPRSVFENKFGEARLYEDAMNFAMQDTYPLAIDEAGITPVAQPAIDVDFENLGKDKDFTYYATVTVKPEVKLGKYEGIEVKALSLDVTDEEVDTEIKRTLEQKAEMVVKEEGKADHGDTVVIDFEGFVDGVAFEGGKAENYSLELGSNSFIPGFEIQIQGMSIGDERDIEVVFPEEYHSENLKGKPATFKVKLHEIKSKVTPELTDEFVKELEQKNHGGEELETVDQYKAHIKHLIGHQKEHARENHIIDTVVDEAANNAEINIPQEMVDEEVNRMLEDTKRQAEQYGLDLKTFLSFSNTDEENYRTTLVPQAEKRVRYNLVLEAIADKEIKEITEEDYEKVYSDLAAQYQMELDQIKAAIQKDMLDAQIKIQKAVDLLVEKAIIE